VHDENLHIIPDTGTDYPQPDVPVNDAWNQMESMLDTGMPSSSSKRKMKGGGGRNSWTSVMIIAGAAWIITWGVIYISNRNKDDKNTKPVIVAQSDLDSVPNKQTSAIDTFGSVHQDAFSLNETSKSHRSEHKTKIVSTDPNVPLKETSKDKTSADVKNGSSPKDLSLKATEESSTDSGKKLDFTYAQIAKGNEDKNQKVKSGNSNQLISNELPEKSRAIFADTNVSTPVIILPAPDQSKKIIADLDDKIISKKVKSDAVSPDSTKWSDKNQGSASMTSPSSKSNASSDGMGITNLFNNSHFGLQWQASLPLYGTDHYFSGYNAKTNISGFIIPGIWVSKQINKHEFTVNFSPFQQHFTNDKLLQSKLIVTDSVIDTIKFTNYKNINLVKTFGFGLGLNYSYEIQPSLLVGVGINYHSQRKALLHEQTLEQPQGTMISDSYYGVRKTDDSWKYLKSGFFTGQLDVAWRRKVFDAGVSIRFPLNNMSAIPEIKVKPINGQVFLRLKIR